MPPIALLEFERQTLVALLPGSRLASSPIEGFVSHRDGSATIDRKLRFRRASASWKHFSAAIGELDFLLQSGELGIVAIHPDLEGRLVREHEDHIRMGERSADTNKRFAYYGHWIDCIWSAVETETMWLLTFRW